LTDNIVIATGLRPKYPTEVIQLFVLIEFVVLCNIIFMIYWTLCKFVSTQHEISHLLLFSLSFLPSCHGSLWGRLAFHLRNPGVAKTHLRLAVINVLLYSAFCRDLQPYNMPPSLYDLINTASQNSSAHLHLWDLVFRYIL